ncbi:hypothetical protein CR513_42661, partial [Mucuna pruriens]
MCLRREEKDQRGVEGSISKCQRKRNRAKEPNLYVTRKGGLTESRVAEGKPRQGSHEGLEEPELGRAGRRTPKGRRLQAMSLGHYCRTSRRDHCMEKSSTPKDIFNRPKKKWNTGRIDMPK